MKFIPSSENKTTLSSLYRFDAVIVNAVDSLKLTVNEMDSQDIHRNEESAAFRDTDVEHAADNIKTCSEVGTLPQGSSRKIKALLPISATNVLDSWYKIFTEWAGRHGAHMKTELSVELTGFE